MTQKKSLIIVSVLVVSLLVGAYFMYQKVGNQFNVGQLATAPQPTEGSNPSETAVAIQAPDFTVYDQQGNPQKLSNFIGKPVVLNFWASWCGPCKSEMPEFQNAFDRYGDRIHFLMVNMTDGAQETVESALSFIANSGYSFPVYFDSDSDAAEKYGVMSIPTTFVIDRYGYVTAWASGAISMETLEQGISMVLQ